MGGEWVYSMGWYRLDGQNGLQYLEETWKKYDVLDCSTVRLDGLNGFLHLIDSTITARFSMFLHPM